MSNAKDMTPSQIPIQSEIAPNGTLDECTASEHFLGKNLEMAKRFFYESSTAYEDLMWMGPIAFRYYVHAAINYFHENMVTLDTIELGEFACALEFRISEERDEVRPVAEVLRTFCDKVINQLSEVQLSDIDSDVIPRYCHLRDSFAALVK